METRSCTKCKAIKPKSEFYEVRRKGKTVRLTARCKKCTCEDTAYAKKSEAAKLSSKQASMRWKQRNLEKVKNKELEREYGITLDDYQKLVENQNGKCGICEKEVANSKRKGLYVDHCHKSSKVRGLLCQKCNQGLGLFDDSIVFLAKAIQYLKRNEHE
jgi:hypothetical protein